MFDCDGYLYQRPVIGVHECQAHPRPHLVIETPSNGALYYAMLWEFRGKCWVVKSASITDAQTGEALPLEISDTRFSTVQGDYSPLKRNLIVKYEIVEECHPGLS